MDEDGYPTEETLKTIREWDVLDFEGLAKFCHKLWRYEDYTDLSMKQDEWDDKEVLTWTVSTGGWSGHEEIISELPKTWKYIFKFSWRTGGHYVFKGK